VISFILDSKPNVRKQSLKAIEVLTDKLNQSSELGKVIQIDYLEVCIEHTIVSLAMRSDYESKLKPIKEEGN